MRVAGYGRTSGDEQEKSETVATQEHYCKDWAERHGHQWVGWYKDEAVPSHVPVADREDGGRLLRDAGRGKFDAVVIYKLGRWSRYMEVWHQGKKALDKLGLALLCVNESTTDDTPSDRFSLNMRLLVTEFQRDDIASNCLDGAYRRVAEYGAYVGGIVPYGYRVTGARRKELQIDEAEAQVIRQIYELAAQGWTCVRIAQHLNATAVPMACMTDNSGRHRAHWRETSGVWLPGRISDLLRSTTYKGIKTYGKRRTSKHALVEQQVPPIVTPALWDAAQATRKTNAKFARRNSKALYPLSGLVRCEHCGYNCFGHTANKDKGRPLRYYICKGRQANYLKTRDLDRPCPVPYLRADELEEGVWATVYQLLKDHEGTAARLRERWATTERRGESLLQVRDGVKAALAKKEEAKRRTIDWGTNGRLTEEEVDEQLTRLRGEVEALKAQLVELDTEGADLAHREQQLTTVTQSLQSWAAQVDRLTTWEERLPILRKLVEGVIVSQEGDQTRVRCRVCVDPTVIETGTRSHSSPNKDWLVELHLAA